VAGACMPRAEDEDHITEVAELLRVGHELGPVTVQLVKPAVDLLRPAKRDSFEFGQDRDPLDLRVEDFGQGVSVALVERPMETAGDLHVLLRHRPPSISGAGVLALVAARLEQRGASEPERRPPTGLDRVAPLRPRAGRLPPARQGATTGPPATWEGAGDRAVDVTARPPGPPGTCRTGGPLERPEPSAAGARLHDGHGYPTGPGQHGGAGARAGLRGGGRRAGRVPYLPAYGGVSTL
jgi:hypothetical protein